MHSSLIVGKSVFARLGEATEMSHGSNDNQDVTRLCVGALLDMFSFNFVITNKIDVVVISIVVSGNISGHKEIISFTVNLFVCLFVSEIS